MRIASFTEIGTLQSMPLFRVSETDPKSSSLVAFGTIIEASGESLISVMTFAVLLLTIGAAFPVLKFFDKGSFF